MTAAVEIRPARTGEAADVAAAVTALIRELRGDPACHIPHAERAAAELIAGPDLGGVLVAANEEAGNIAGVVGYSFPTTIRAGGRYCLIQELWVDPQLRRDGVARRLLEELQCVCMSAGLRRLEVCLPALTFPGFPQTSAFYVASGFQDIGPRLIKDLA